MFNLFRAITVTGFLSWFSIFFVLFFPASSLQSAVRELWQHPLIYLPEVFLQSRLLDRTTLFGIAVGLIFYGGLCDRIGRYDTMLFCLVCAPISATICGYFADAWLFVILHFVVGVSAGGVLVSSTTLIFEVTSPINRRRMFSVMIVGGVLGAIVSFFLGSIGWRSLYQIQLLPVFLVPLLWHWSDESLLWKFAVRDKSEQKNSSSVDNSDKLPVKKLRGVSGFFRRCYVLLTDKLAGTYLASLGEVLSKRQHLLLAALFLVFFGLCGLIISFMSLGEGVRQRVYQSYDLDVRSAFRVQNNEVVVDDIDAALVAYIIEKPRVLDLIKSDESRIDLLPQVVRSYGYSRDDIPGCVADGLLELVNSLRGERLTQELVAERAVLRWNSKFGKGRAETDIPEFDKRRIRLKAGLFLVNGETTLQEILVQNQQADGRKKTRDFAGERRRTSVEKWREWCDEFLSMWDELLFVTENRYWEGEWCVGWTKLYFLFGCLVCGSMAVLGVGINILGSGWTQRRIFCVMFVLFSLLSMMALMLWGVGVSFGVSLFYVFICGIIFVPFVVCYLTTIPAMFPVTHRGAAVGICFGVPLLVVFQVICVVPVPYIYFLIPISFVAGVFATGMSARKKRVEINITKNPKT
ncbi:MAG: MFS transporter [Planctomycetaceae bacterium]|jgi:MFS family permease|nr:MFS transporter [Planctomycetaceae bacterium]